ncbi:MAG TPA: hypothetical protein VGR61_05420, partial [Candidatus Dormibacteraeota bacterium]|nr:hypothetical protein [Candidatus Dormibacteraeota bacterium]
MNKRFLSLGSAVAVVLGLMIPVTAPTALAAAAPCLSPGTLGTHAVAVDAGGGAFGEAPPPVGHNYEFVDYFPRGGAAPVVENGDCLQFNFDGGFHTVSFFTSSDSPATHPWTTKPFAVPDTGSTDTGEGPLVNPGAFAPSPPTCGVFATPCGLTGTGFTNSGGNGGGGTWWAKLNLTNAGFTGSLWYFCLIHPSMSGHVTVALPAAAARTSPATENAVALT